MTMKVYGFCYRMHYYLLMQYTPLVAAQTPHCCSINNNSCVLHGCHRLYTVCACVFVFVCEHDCVCVCMGVCGQFIRCTHAYSIMKK